MQVSSVPCEALNQKSVEDEGCKLVTPDLAGLLQAEKELGAWLQEKQWS